MVNLPSTQSQVKLTSTKHLGHKYAEMYKGLASRCMHSKVDSILTKQGNKGYVTCYCETWQSVIAKLKWN